MAEVNVVNNKNEKVGTVKLDEKIFNGNVNKPLLQQVISMYLANQRTGSASTKTRGEVRGGGKKPWRQKGTGRARHGSIRSPIWKGGGVVFGPHPKDWHYRLPRRMRRIALISSINAKLNEKNITVIDKLKLDSNKTKELSSILKGLKLGGKKIVIVPDKADDNLKRAARNIKDASLVRAEDINAYQVLINDNILVEKDALKKIEKESVEVI